MLKRNNKLIKTSASIILSISLAMSSVDIGTIDTKIVSAKSTTNPIDTGNGYEYSNGRAIGRYLRTDDNGSGLKVIDEDTLKIIADEYNYVTDDQMELSYRFSNFTQNKTKKRFPENYYYFHVEIYTVNTSGTDKNSHIYKHFYALTDENYLIFDYGKIEADKNGHYSDSSISIPYGSTKGYDYYGYDKEGYDATGYDYYGYDRTGYNADGYDKKGYNKEGYDKDGYDRDGYNKEGYNVNGYGRDGYDKDGYNVNGYDRDGYDKEGYNVNGYGRDGYNRYGYDSDGYGRDGYNKDGYDRDGYGRNGYNRYGYDKNGYNKDGYYDSQYDKNKNNYDEYGYDKFGYDKNGYNRLGVNKEGYDKNGAKAKSKVDTDKGYEYNVAGGGCGINIQQNKSLFYSIVSREYNIAYDPAKVYTLKKANINSSYKSIRYPAGYSYDYVNIAGTYIYCLIDSTGQVYDYGKMNVTGEVKHGAYFQSTPLGGTYAYDYYGIDKNGYNKEGYDREGYNKAGYNAAGYNRDGYKTDGYNDAGYDKDGYMRDGYNDAGYDREGYDRDGYNAKGYDKDGYDRDGYNKKGYDAYGYDRDGFDKDGLDSEGYDRHGYDRDTYNRNGDSIVDFTNKFTNAFTDGYIYTENNGVESWCEFKERSIPNDLVEIVDWSEAEKRKNHAIVEKYFNDELKKGRARRWYKDGRMADLSGYYKWDCTGYYNFEIVGTTKEGKSLLRDYYVNNATSIGLVAPKTRKESRTKYQSAVAYITVPQSYVKNKYYILINGRPTRLVSRNIKVNIHFGDMINIGAISKKVINKKKKSVFTCLPFSYKLVPSTTWFKKSSMSRYTGKLMNIENTKVTTSSKKVKHDMLYLANIDPANVVVSSSNNSIVKVAKEKYSYPLKYFKKSKYYKYYKEAKIDAVKLTGGSKSGTATVTIKDKKSGKTQKITVTNK